MSDIMGQLRAIASRGRMDDADVQVIFDAADEIERLSRWKVEALILLGQWEESWRVAGAPGELGESKPKALAAEVQRLRAVLVDADRLADRLFDALRSAREVLAAIPELNNALVAKR
jgi:hypothetical protein